MSTRGCASYDALFRERFVHSNGIVAAIGCDQTWSPGHITDLLVTDLEEAGLHKKSLTSFGWPCGDELSSKS